MNMLCIYCLVLFSCYSW